MGIRLPFFANIPNTSRIEAYSDGVFAIVVTLLVLELRVPEIKEPGSAGVIAALLPLVPKFTSFTVSFFTLAVFWVNHHALYHTLVRSDAKLLWLNNVALFWLSCVPFTTALVGSYPSLPLVVGLYGLVMSLAGASFVLMGYWAWLRSDLADPELTREARQRAQWRGWIGVALYASATGLAFVHTFAALVLMAAIPFLYVVPHLMRRGDAQ